MNRIGRLAVGCVVACCGLVRVVHNDDHPSSSFQTTNMHTCNQKQDLRKFYCDTATFGLASLNIRQARRTFSLWGCNDAGVGRLVISICTSTMPHRVSTHTRNPQTNHKIRPWSSSRRAGSSSARTRPWTWPTRAASTSRACRAWRSAVRHCVCGGFVIAGGDVVSASRVGLWC